MVEVGVSSWVLSELRRPSNHLSNELLSRRLLAVECTQESKELSLIRGIWNELALCVDGDEEDGQVTAGATLLGLQEGECDGVEDVNCCIPVLCLDVAGGDDAGLLLGFVVLGFCDPGEVLVTICQ